jgi:hypothetical protein
MITWDNLFDGYNVYNDVFTAYPSLYAQASEGLSMIDLYNSIIHYLPQDVQLLFAVFFLSTKTIVLWLALIFVMFMPIIRAPQKWLR